MDRDGTLSHEVGYVNHPSRFRLYPWTADAVRAINQARWLAVVVTNQAGVARGYFPESVFEEVQQRLRGSVEAGGARFDAVYACLHHPSVGDAPVPRGLRLPQAAARAAAARRGRARRRPRALVGDRRPPRRPAARLERGRARGAREERLRAGRAHLPRPELAAPARPRGREPAGGGRADPRPRTASEREPPRGSRRWCARFRGRRVLVLADLVADEFVYGRVERISREAPVLILRHDATDVRLGGGANAVHNIRTLGARPLPFGVAGRRRARAAAAGAAAREAHRDHGHRQGTGYATPVKTRVLAGRAHSTKQQIVRLDRYAPLRGAQPGAPRARARAALRSAARWTACW